MRKSDIEPMASMKEIRENSQNEIKEVKPKKKKLSKRFFLLYLAIFGFALYASITIINQHIAINEKRTELQVLQEELQIIEIENDYLDEVKNYKGDDLDEYIENIAREDLDYVKNGERVFINVSGD